MKQFSLICVALCLQFGTSLGESGKAIPTKLRFPNTVQLVTNSLNSQRLETVVSNLTNYHTRHFASESGVAAQKWMLSQVQAAVQGYPGPTSVSEVDHGFPTKSIVAILEGDSSSRDVVILGGHIDSVNMDGPDVRAPGADDNGSGASVILETLRALVQARVRLNHTVHFHWYTAHEEGLLGSANMAQYYRILGVNVLGMLNINMIGYYEQGVDSVGVFVDDASPDLAKFIHLLTDGYLEFGAEDNYCGNGCSDYASWNASGFPAVMASEVVVNPYMHTVNDTVENINFKQITEYLKLAVAFVVEMGEPSNE